MTGDVFIIINGQRHDAFTSWGIDFEDGAISTLMTPAPMKDYVESESRLSHGKEVDTDNAKFDARELTLPFHLIANSKADFFTKYDNFCTEVLGAGGFELQSGWQPGVAYRLVYKSCTQFRQFHQKKAKFMLKVSEPDPTDRIPTTVQTTES